MYYYCIFVVLLLYKLFNKMTDVQLGKPCVVVRIRPPLWEPKYKQIKDQEHKAKFGPDPQVGVTEEGDGVESLEKNEDGSEKEPKAFQPFRVNRAFGPTAHEDEIWEQMKQLADWIFDSHINITLFT